jgi:hypothetical protein
MKNKTQILLLLFIISILVSSFIPGEISITTDEEIKKLSNDWMIAAKTRDGKTLNKLVAPEFKLSGTNKEMPTVARDIWMKNTMENLLIDSFSYSNMEVAIVDNVAIVQSNFYWSVSFKGLPARTDTAQLIDTWIKRKLGWQVVNRIVVD